MTQVVFNEWKETYRAEGRAEGREEGIVEGMEKGLVKGREEGLIEGEARGEARKAMEGALNLLRRNISVETIAMCLDIPVEKVRELAAGLKRD